MHVLGPKHMQSLQGFLQGREPDQKSRGSPIQAGWKGFLTFPKW